MDNVRIMLLPGGKMPENLDVERHVAEWPTDSGRSLVYKMAPGESVLVGIGFVTEMVFPMFYWVAPRSGLASKGYGLSFKTIRRSVGFTS